MEFCNSASINSTDRNILSNSPVDKDKLCQCLSLFVVEARSSDGNQNCLLAGLLHYMRDFLDTSLIWDSKNYIVYSMVSFFHEVKAAS